MRIWYWDYPLDHPGLAAFMRDCGMKLRFFGIVLSRNTALGFIVRSKREDR